MYKLQQCNSLIDVITFIDENIDIDRLNKIRLMDYFELIKFKPTKINNSKNGKYPLYSSSKESKPVKYIDCYTINTNGENWIQLNKNGSVGYCFIRNGKFSITQDIYLLKPKNCINLDNNIKLLSLQISNMGFGFENKINTERLNNIEVYITV